MLRIESISKRYGKGPLVNDAVSIELRPGELTALIGHNGAGKTTLLSQICGVVRPTSGDIRFGEVSFVSQPDLARRACSLMAQLHAPIQGMTPRAMISSVARLRGASAADAQARTADVIERLSIGEWADKPGQKLSGGLRRMTSYAMAVVLPPPILLIDEPTNDVDPQRRPVIWRDLRGLAEDGHIVVVVSHNLLEVERAADRVVLMKEAKVVMDGTPQSIAAAAGASTLKVLWAGESQAEGLPPNLGVSAELPRQTSILLAPAQVPDAARWAAGLTESGVAESFVLEPMSLENVYGKAHE
ncbi:ABC transporter ATP-binding protein [Falsarthrobacter nasiphocae]|uniref:ABC-2 type transport system ATP-binding protein n=1 Tax=Falsarthrobacter nasiphocae TaxID=189863 RepID=A0AAE3YG07_9MICC|nr:ABC transporter ATP-binding protein [Falsarthrobacter nasiphocae]MDR6892754.1 ABC-2 type transport system ATP-binding protein [Falsarthrobacter nasiphocae]